MEARILETDTRFTNSPDAGPECICSRCGDPITEVPVIRAWPEAVFNYEYRYHLQCILPGAQHSDEYYDIGDYE